MHEICWFVMPGDLRARGSAVHRGRIRGSLDAEEVERWCVGWALLGGGGKRRSGRKEKAKGEGVGDPVMSMRVEGRRECEERRFCFFSFF